MIIVCCQVVLHNYLKHKKFKMEDNLLPPTFCATFCHIFYFYIYYKLHLPVKSHGWRSLEGCSPWGRCGSDTNERLHFDFSLSCIGEGNGNPLQCSCLKNRRDGGVWWAAICGVAQSQTRLKRLSSSSSSSSLITIQMGSRNILSLPKPFPLPLSL